MVIFLNRSVNVKSTILIYHAKKHLKLLSLYLPLKNWIISYKNFM
jgi:hypothetical protein